jgi:sulfonate transport system ATP-binding protein
MINDLADLAIIEAMHLRDSSLRDRFAEEVPPRRVAPHRCDPGITIRLDGIEKRFGDHIVLRDLSLDIRAGEFLAIVGHSGCGKSTLLRLIAGLDAPSTGVIELGGRRVAGRADEARLLFQDARLLPWRRVLENVGIGLSGGWRAEAHETLRAMGLEDRSRDWPSVLSGGQRQRVALARALVSQPRLLLLDEPLGALDALTRLEMQTLIESVWQTQGFTVVLVTHDVAEAVALADRVIVLDGGGVGQELRVPQSRPRRRGSAELAALEGWLLARLLRKRGDEAAARLNPVPSVRRAER